MLFLGAAGCRFGAPADRDPAQLAVELSRRVASLEGLAAEPEIRHLLAGCSAPQTWALVSSTASEHYVHFFERRGRSPLEPVFRAALHVGPGARAEHTPFPARARFLDADGEGAEELLLVCDSFAADRAMQSFLLFARCDGGWQVHVGPPVAGGIRRELGEVGIYAEDFMQAVSWGGSRHDVQPLSNGGGWRFLPHPDGDGALFLANVTLPEGEATHAPHRRAALAWRFPEGGFERDPAWNGGRIFATREPLSGEELREWLGGLTARGPAPGDG